MPKSLTLKTRIARINRPASMLEGRVHAVIDTASPAAQAGRCAMKRVQRDVVRVKAHCFADSHDALRVVATDDRSEIRALKALAPDQDLTPLSLFAHRRGAVTATVEGHADD